VAAMDANRGQPLAGGTSETLFLVGAGSRRSRSPDLARATMRLADADGRVSTDELVDPRRCSKPWPSRGAEHVFRRQVSAAADARPSDRTRSTAVSSRRARAPAAGWYGSKAAIPSILRGRGRAKSLEYLRQANRSGRGRSRESKRPRSALRRPPNSGLPADLSAMKPPR